MEHKVVPFELTKVNTEERIFEGYASTFGNLDLGDDIIHPGAFAKTLARYGPKVKVLWQHDTKEPLGKPVELFEDSHGLFIKAFLSNTQRGREAIELLRDGALDSMSIGYDVQPGGADYSKQDGRTIRNLREIRLWEVSLVTFPMNEEAVVTGVKEMKPYPNEHACRLRDPGDFEEDSFRRTGRQTAGKKYNVVMGKLKGESTMTEQAYRYPKADWPEADAKRH
jgi:HK97 family phage prohead protease